MGCLNPRLLSTRRVLEAIAWDGAIGILPDNRLAMCIDSRLVALDEAIAWLAERGIDASTPDLANRALDALEASEVSG